MAKMERPRIYGDRLMVHLVKADKELQMIDNIFFERDDYFVLIPDSDAAMDMQKKLEGVYGKLQADKMRGENAVTWIKKNIVDTSPYDSLLLRMEESGEFPEITELMALVDEHA